MEDGSAVQLGNPQLGVDLFHIVNLTGSAIDVLMEIENGRIQGIPEGIEHGSERGYRVAARYESAGLAFTERHDFYIRYTADTLGNEIPIVSDRYGEVFGLPAPVIGTKLIVTKEVAEAARANGRTTKDLLVAGRRVMHVIGEPLGYAELKEV
jgi:hypothetical protein